MKKAQKYVLAQGYKISESGELFEPEGENPGRLQGNRNPWDNSLGAGSSLSPLRETGEHESPGR